MFASNSKRKRSLQNWIIKVEENALLIEIIHKAIPNQYTRMANIVLVPKMV